MDTWIIVILTAIVFLSCVFSRSQMALVIPIITFAIGIFAIIGHDTDQNVVDGIRLACLSSSCIAAFYLHEAKIHELFVMLSYVFFVLFAIFGATFHNKITVFLPIGSALVLAVWGNLSAKSEKNTTGIEYISLTLACTALFNAVMWWLPIMK